MDDLLKLEERVRKCLKRARELEEVTGDFAVAGVKREERALTPAAVLVPLIKHSQGLTVLLTQRTDHLINHAGQVSFPGGRVEDQDAGPVETALRETEEEIGLNRRHVEVAGFLDLYQTVTGFLITPVVSFVTPPFDLDPDPFEVAEVFEVPLEFILDTRNHEYHNKFYKGRERRFYVIPYENRYIWGATAAMLIGFSRQLKALENR